MHTESTGRYHSSELHFTSPMPVYGSKSNQQRHGSGVAKGGGASSPIFQTKHKHTYKLHKIRQCGQFIFGKIIKTVATRSHLLKLKYTKFGFGWGAATNPAGETYYAPTNPLAGF